MQVADKEFSHQAPVRYKCPNEVILANTLQKPSKEPVNSFTSINDRSILTNYSIVNDPAPVPHPSPSHGSYHWTFERLIAVGMIPLTVAPFAAGSLNPATDAILCATVLIHSHIGFESCVIDYFPVKEYPGLRMFFWWGLRAATLVVAVGLYEFETNDVGLTEAIKRVWTA